MRRSRLDGKKAVITGAASGLGRSLAVLLAAEGWKIGIVDINDVGAGQTLDMVEGAGGTGEVFHADVSEPGDVKAFADHFFDLWGGVDLLVNNAGVVVAGLIGEIPLQDWDWIFGISFWGMLYGCHEFVPRMKSRGSGHILNIASAGGLLNFTNMGPYNTAKAAVISLSETLRMELAPYDVGVTVACPTFFKTNLLQCMRYRDEWELEVSHSTFDHARLTSDDVANRIIRAVKKNRLYVIPQPTGRALWLIKRLTPETNFNIYAFLNSHGILRPLTTMLARRGML